MLDITSPTSPQPTALHRPTAYASVFGNASNFRGLATDYLADPEKHVYVTARDLAAQGFARVLFRGFPGAPPHRSKANGWKAQHELDPFWELDQPFKARVFRAIARIRADFPALEIGVSGFWLVEGQVFTATTTQRGVFKRLMRQLRTLGVSWFYHDSVGGADKVQTHAGEQLVPRLGKSGLWWCHDAAAEQGLSYIAEGICDESLASGVPLVRIHKEGGTHLPWNQGKTFSHASPCVCAISDTDAEADVKAWAALGYPIWASNVGSRPMALKAARAMPMEVVKLPGASDAEPQGAD